MFLFNIAKWLDKNIFGENKIYLKQGKSGQFKVKYRGRFWSALCHLIGREIKYDLNKIFNLPYIFTKDKMFSQIKTKEFYRTQSTHSINIALDILNHDHRLYNRRSLQNILQSSPNSIDELKILNDFFIPKNFNQEPPKTRDKLNDLFIKLLESYQHQTEGIGKIHAKKLIEFIDSIYKRSDAMDDGSPTIKIKIAQALIGHQPLSSYDSTWVNLNRLTDNLLSLLGSKVSVSELNNLQYIIRNARDYNPRLHEKIPQKNFSIFRDTDTFAEKLLFIENCPAFFDHRFDVLKKLRTENTKLRSHSSNYSLTELNEFKIAIHPDQLITAINKYCADLNLYQKFIIIREMTAYNLEQSTIETFLNYIQNYSIQNKNEREFENFLIHLLMTFRNCKQLNSVNFLVNNLDAITDVAMEFELKISNPFNHSILECELKEDGNLYSNLLDGVNIGKKSPVYLFSGTKVILESSPIYGNTILKSFLNSHFFDDNNLLNPFVQKLISPSTCIDKTLKKTRKFLIVHYYRIKPRQSNNKDELLMQLAKIPLIWQHLISPLVNMISEIYKPSTEDYLKKISTTSNNFTRESTCLGFVEKTIQDHKIKTLFLSLQYAASLSPKGINSELNSDIITRIISPYIGLREKDLFEHFNKINIYTECQI